jgi:esterase/lipase superfamily enzyme
MLRSVGLALAWMAAVSVCCVVLAQQPGIERRPLRVRSAKPPALQNGEVDSAAIKRADNIATSDQERALDRLGAGRPSAYSARADYLVAAVREGHGLALWDAQRRIRLRRLEKSDRQYSLLAISDDARWIAGVRLDDDGQVDLWLAADGRHLRTIKVAAGAKTKLQFEAGDQLRIVAADGQEVAIRIPAGVAVDGFSDRDAAKNGKTPRPQFSRPEAVPAAPGWAGPKARPPMASGDEGPRAVAPTPQNAPRVEPRIPAMPLPRMMDPGDVIVGEPRSAAPSPSIVGSGPESPFERFRPTAPAPGSAFAPPTPTAPSPYNPSGGSAPPPAQDDANDPVAESAPQGPQRRFEFRMDDESTTDESAPPAPEEPETESTASAVPNIPAPSSVSVHFATNRNRLAPKDRAWSVYFFGFFSSLPAFVIYGAMGLSLLVAPWFGRRTWAATAVLAGSVVLCSMGLVEAYVRSQLRDEMSGELYGCRPTDVSYGVCEISVPPPQNRRPGEWSRPLSVWIFEASEDPDEHFMLRRVLEHRDKDEFYRSLSMQMRTSKSRTALLFIHGYNVSFEDAIFRTAQLAVDLKFPGAPIAFCWPSYADPVKYTFDEQQAEVSTAALREVLNDLASRGGAKQVHIIAHSMGNRVLAGALARMRPEAQQRNKQVFREMVLAAPDIDRRVFQSQILPDIANNAQHCTLYASSRDRALLVSRCFHNYQRLGEAQPDLVLANGLETIDASLVDTSLLGHSYIGDVQSIVSDLHDLLVGGKWAADRMGLQLFERSTQRYWSIKPQLQAATDPSLTR